MIKAQLVQSSYANKHREIKQSTTSNTLLTNNLETHNITNKHRKLIQSTTRNTLANYLRNTLYNNQVMLINIFFSMFMDAIIAQC